MHLVAAFFLENARDMKRLGSTLPFRYVKMLFSEVYNVSVRRVGNIAIRKKTKDILVLRQVFGIRQYEIKYYPQAERINKRYRRIIESGKTPLIIDAGANNGCSALWFAIEFPDSKIAAIEPDHENCEMCRTNTRSRPEISVIEAAIGGVPGFVTLQNPLHESWAVQATRGCVGKKVEVRTLNDVVNSFGPEYELFIAKIDIEGFESDLFSHDTDWLKSVMVLIIEPHDWMLPGQFSSVPFQRAMAKHKFEVLLSDENLIYVADVDTTGDNSAGS